MSVTKSDQKIIALGIKTGKMTAETLKNMILSFFEQKEQRILQAEQKTYEEFQSASGSAGGSLVNFAIHDSNIQSFDTIATQYHIQYSLKKDLENDRYYVLFQGKDLKTIESALKQYVTHVEQLQKQTQEKTIRPEKAPSVKQKTKEREQEKV